MPVAKETPRLNVQRLCDLAEKKIAESLVDTMVSASMHLRGGEFASEAHAIIARHRDRLAETIAALEASK